MTGSLDDLSFAAWPPAIDISTPANSQSFNPLFLQQQFQFFRVNQVLPGTVFALTPTDNSSSD